MTFLLNVLLNNVVYTLLHTVLYTKPNTVLYSLLNTILYVRMYKEVNVVGLYSQEHYRPCPIYNVLNTILYTKIYTLMFIKHYTTHNNKEIHFFY